MTKEISPLTARADSRDVPCAFAAEGLCEGDGDRRCCDCQRYNELLREAIGLYPDVRWVLTPDGMLYGLTDG